MDDKQELERLLAEKDRIQSEYLKRAKELDQLSAENQTKDEQIQSLEQKIDRIERLIQTYRGTSNPTGPESIEIEFIRQNLNWIPFLKRGQPTEGLNGLLKTPIKQIPQRLPTFIQCHRDYVVKSA